MTMMPEARAARAWYEIIVANWERWDEDERAKWMASMPEAYQQFLNYLSAKEWDEVFRLTGMRSDDE